MVRADRLQFGILLLGAVEGHGQVLDFEARVAVLEVRAGNAAARALYERLGFVVVGERRKYYREPVEDALIMTRPLAAEA